MRRIYQDVIDYHYKNYSQMLFLSGGRQVGKTTLARQYLSQKKGEYLNWDVVKDREVILDQRTLFSRGSLMPELGQTNLLVMDEVHKYKDWKNHIKGLYDIKSENVQIMLTGSARMDVYRKGGDSLMGRYFAYTVHPFSVREATLPEIKMDLLTEISAPLKISDEDFESLWSFGGFPDPFLNRNLRFYNQWKKLRLHQLFREDIRDLSLVHDIAQLELLALLIEEYSGQTINYSAISKRLRITDVSLRRWLDLLENMYYSFRVYPWSSSISRSLLKMPKIYLLDWSSIKNEGQRFENFIASHLLKAVSFWNETGLGNYELFYIRTKDQKEVDFCVTKNSVPWFLVEAKTSNSSSLSKSLIEFHEILKTQHAFQVVLNSPFVDQSCFDEKNPIIVPAKTLLSQLV